MVLRKSLKCAKCNAPKRTPKAKCKRCSNSGMKRKAPRIRNGYKLQHFNANDQRDILNNVNYHRADRTNQHPKYVQMMIGKSIRKFLTTHGMDLECPPNQATYNLINHPAITIMLQKDPPRSQYSSGSSGVLRGRSQDRQRRSRARSRSQVVRRRSRSKSRVAMGRNRSRSRSVSAAVRAAKAKTKAALKRARSKSRSTIMRARSRSADGRRRSASRSRKSSSRVVRVVEDAKYMYPI